MGEPCVCACWNDPVDGRTYRPMSRLILLQGIQRWTQDRRQILKTTNARSQPWRTSCFRSQPFCCLGVSCLWLMTESWHSKKVAPEQCGRAKWSAHREKGRRALDGLDILTPLKNGVLCTLIQAVGLRALARSLNGLWALPNVWLCACEAPRQGLCH